MKDGGFWDVMPCDSIDELYISSKLASVAGYG
jgi:hypothetical protein